MPDTLHEHVAKSIWESAFEAKLVRLTDEEWRELKAKISLLLSKQQSLIDSVVEITRGAEETSIYRPLHAFSRLRRLRVDRERLWQEIDGVIKDYDEVIASLPRGTMGEILVSVSDSLHLKLRADRLEQTWIEANNCMRQAGAFALGVFALYVALISTVLTVILR